MILLNSALCSKDFRKVGIIHAGVLIFFQIILLIFLAIYTVSSDEGAYEFRRAFFRNNTMICLFFVLIEIVLYSLLIYGLVKRKPTILLLWLTFAPLEFFIALMALSFIVYAITHLIGVGAGIVALIIYVLITSFMFHNICVVYSARHGFIRGQESRNINVAYQPTNATATMTNASAPAYHQCNQQHLEYNEKVGQYAPCKCTYPQLPPNYQETD